MPRAHIRKKDGVVKYRNISVDSDIADLLNAKADDLAETFGFRPTLSQTLRHLMKKG
jgi:hypothetical protein